MRNEYIETIKEKDGTLKSVNYKGVIEGDSVRQLREVSMEEENKVEKVTLVIRDAGTGEVRETTVEKWIEEKKGSKRADRYNNLIEIEGSKLTLEEYETKVKYCKRSAVSLGGMWLHLSKEDVSEEKYGIKIPEGVTAINTELLKNSVQYKSREKNIGLPKQYESLIYRGVPSVLSIVLPSTLSNHNMLVFKELCGYIEYLEEERRVLDPDLEGATMLINGSKVSGGEGLHMSLTKQTLAKIPVNTKWKVGEYDLTEYLLSKVDNKGVLEVEQLSGRKEHMGENTIELYDRRSKKLVIKERDN